MDTLPNKDTKNQAQKLKYSFAILQRGYWMIPRMATKSGFLTAFDSLVLGMIVSLTIGQDLYKDGVEPSQEYISKETGASIITVKRAFRKLAELKLLESIRRGQGKTNIYKLTDEGIAKLNKACE